MKNIYLAFAFIAITVVNTNVFASGKQFRPPQVDICDIDPDSEDCKSEDKDGE